MVLYARGLCVSLWALDSQSIAIDVDRGPGLEAIAMDLDRERGSLRGDASQRPSIRLCTS